MNSPIFLETATSIFSGMGGFETGPTVAPPSTACQPVAATAGIRGCLDTRKGVDYAGLTPMGS